MKIVFRMKSIFLYLNFKTSPGMKKSTVVLLIAFVTILVVSSCNKKECPAYSKANTEQAGRNA
jgi:hypothetical protein